MNLAIKKTIEPENRPSFNEWCKQFKFGSSYIEPNLTEVRNPDMSYNQSGRYSMEKLIKVFRVK